MKVILILLILTVLGKAAEWIYYQVRFRARKPRGFASFDDFTRDPNRADRARGLLQAHADDLKQLRGKLIGELVNELATPRARRNVAVAIEERAGVAMPALLKALQNPKFRVPYSEEHRKRVDIFFRAATPLEAVLTCLSAHPHPAMVPAVLPFAADPSDAVRKSVAGIVCEFPGDDTLPAIKKLLSDRDEYVRHRAAAAIETAVEVGRVTPGARDAIYPVLLSLIGTDPAHNERAPACLIALDKTRAAADLVKPELLTLKNRAVAGLLKALDAQKIAIPDPTVIQLLADAEAAPDEYPHRGVISELMRQLAERRSPLLDDAIRRNAKSSSADAREAAAEAMCTINGLSDPWGSAYRQADDEGIDNVPAPVRHVVLCSHLTAQVNNGGFAQYFANGYGKEWRRTLEALAAVNAPRTHALLKAAVEKFGPDGPAESRYDRAVAELCQRKHKPWESEDQDFFEDEDARETLLLQYMLSNAQHFR